MIYEYLCRLTPVYTPHLNQKLNLLLKYYLLCLWEGGGGVNELYQ